tara:strand:+ start:19453 stop:20778 length:1326 start_codon:yes stop_codon:yes gene_type:complete
MIFSKFKRILSLSIPIIGGMMSQNILNLVDTLMIGQLGHVALAGTGVGAFLFFVSFAGFTGIASGVQTMVARYVGQSQQALISVALILGLILSVTGSIIVVFGQWFFLDGLIGLFSTDQGVLLVAQDYYGYRLLGLPFLTFCLVIRGFWNGISEPRRYLVVIVVIHVLNVLFNYCFIFGKFGFPAMQAAGAGLASSLSLVIGSVIYGIDCKSYLLIRSFFNLSKDVLKDTLNWLLNLGIPTSIQQFFFALGVAVFYWVLGQLGTVEMAIGNVLVNIVLVGILPGIGLAMATMTLVSQSLGEKKVTETFYWPFYVSILALLGVGSLVLGVLCFPKLILQPFIVDETVLQRAILPLRLDAIGVLLEVLALIFMYALNGVDRTRFVMIASIICQWIFLLPITYWISIMLGYGLVGAWASWLFFQLLQVLVFSGAWLRLRFRLFA